MCWWFFQYQYFFRGICNDRRGHQSRPFGIIYLGSLLSGHRNIIDSYLHPVLPDAFLQSGCKSTHLRVALEGIFL
jgi:hypothetical protein